MNVLLVGAGTAGSWQIRGVQLGAALGARVTTAPTADDWVWADIIVLVKRALSTWGTQARRTGKPVVWDAVDFWTQPAQNALDRDAAIAMARAYMAPVAPDLVIGATDAMAAHLGGVCVPHHARPGLQPRPVCEDVSVVAYEGNPAYLGRWAGELRAACARRGWMFVVNPPDLSVADLIVALRYGVWDGWVCREWKSGVKIANALAVGRPLVTQESAAAREIGAGVWLLPAHHMLDHTLDWMADYDERLNWAREARVLAERFSLATVATRYRQILERVLCPA